MQSHGAELAQCGIGRTLVIDHGFIPLIPSFSAQIGSTEETRGDL